jgi:O-antigen biosynthesis protein
MLVQRKRIVGSALILGGDAGYVALDSGCRIESAGLSGRSRVAQHVTALDHGCIVLRRSLFAEASGFDPSYGDLSAATVDLMLRIAGQGLRHHYVPSVQVQSTWRWPNFTRMRAHAADRKRLIAAWKLDQWVDRAWNPNLGLRRTRGRYAFPPRVSLDRPWFEPKPEPATLSETLPPMPLPVHRATTGSCSGT